MKEVNFEINNMWAVINVDKGEIGTLFQDKTEAKE